MLITLSAPANQVTVSVYTTSFRRVNEIVLTNVPAGTSEETLPLTDRSGVPLANGLYYIVVHTPQGRFLSKLIVLR